MASLPKFRRILKEDVKEAPSWVDRMLFVLNGFMDAVYVALNGNITLVNNVRAYVYSFSITAGAAATDNTAQFTLPTGFPVPSLLFLGKVTQRATVYTPIASAVFASWRFDGVNVIIDAITGLINGQIYDVTVLLY